jgi:hypothetical protein
MFDLVIIDPVIQFVLVVCLGIVVMDLSKWFLKIVWKKLGGDDEEW